MNAPVRIVLLGLDEPTVDRIHEALEHETGLEFETLADGLDHVARIQQDPPQLIVAAQRSLEAGDRSLARRLHVRPGRPLILTLVGREGPSGAVPLGADDWLAWPSTPAEIRGRIGAVLRLAQGEEQLHLERERLQSARQSLSQRFRKLLGDLLDLCIPGARDRGERVAQLALQIAGRFEVPAELLSDLELAAQLHELGALVAREEDHGSSPVGTESWGTAAGTREIFECVEEFQSAAEVVGAIYENWDGTGLPDHLLQGQVPLRSRILRAVIDYDTALSTGRRTPAEIVAHMMEHKGTRYDPLVLVHLEALLSGLNQAEHPASFRVIPIDSLEPGMVLADDLYTPTGIKLVSRGTRLGPGAIESILRRHRSEPIHHGVSIERTGT